MRFACLSLAVAFLLTPALAQEKSEGPADERARKTYEKALKSLHERDKASALDNFKKADKQDGGHCLDCQIKMIKYGVELAEWKTAELAAEEMLAQAHGNKDTALAHYQFAVVLLDEAQQKHKEELFARATRKAPRPSPPILISRTRCGPMAWHSRICRKTMPQKPALKNTSR